MTRTVYLIHRWAIKIPSLRAHRHSWYGAAWSFTRGLQANLSEWGNRKSANINPPLWTILGLISVYPRAEQTPPGKWPTGTLPGIEQLTHNVGDIAGSAVWIDYDTSVHDLHQRQQAKTFGLPLQKH